MVKEGLQAPVAAGAADRGAAPGRGKQDRARGGSERNAGCG